MPTDNDVRRKSGADLRRVIVAERAADLPKARQADFWGAG